jgi:hypothetical protein
MGIEPVILGRSSVPTEKFPNNDARDLIHPGRDFYKTLAHQVKNMLDEPAVI